MNVNDAVIRQWIRDNRDNIAWDTLGIKNVDRFANSLNIDSDRLCELVDKEMGEQHTFEDFKARRSDAESVLGLKRCAYCHEMVADPIDSQPAGGKLCRGCERWFERGKLNPELGLVWQVWVGQSVEMNRFHEKMSRAYKKAKEAEEQWWADLRKRVNSKPKHKKHICVETDDEDYQTAVDVRLSHGEDWRNL